MGAVWRNLLSVALAWGLATGGLVGLPNAAVAASVPVSIGAVNGAFYANPNNSGSLDLSNLVTPVFSQSFPVIDFDPPASAQVTCSNSTGIDENYRPFTDVIPNSDGTCSTSTVQGNGQQAGVGNLFTFQAILTANLAVAAPGQVTFNLFSDDGWMLGVGPRQGGTEQPSYVSGSFANPLPTTPGQSLPVVGSYNVPSAPAQNQVTVAFPAAGTYPLELDYTECCGGQLSLVLGTTFGNPIPPSPQCSATPASQSLADQFGAALCAFAQNMAATTDQEVNILKALSTLPQVQLGQNNAWLIPASGTFSVAQIDAINAAFEIGQRLQSKAISDTFDKITQAIKDKISGGACAPSAIDDLNQADQSLQDEYQGEQNEWAKFTEVNQFLQLVKAGTVGGAQAVDIAGAVDQGANDTLDAQRAYLDALNHDAAFLTKALQGCFLTQGEYETLVQQYQIVVSIVGDSEGKLQTAYSGMGYIAQGAFAIMSQVGNGPGLPVPSNPSQSVTALSFPPAVQPPQTVTPAPQPPPNQPIVNVNGGTCPDAILQGGTGCTTGNFGTGFNSAQGVVFVNSTPTRLANFTTDANGAFTVSFVVPAQTEPGVHELYVISAAPNGNLGILGVPITVLKAPGPQAKPLCLGTTSGTINGGLDVPRGMVCTLSNAVVNGTVTVESGAFFEADDSTINGGVIAASPTAFVLCGDQVNGTVSVQSSALPALIGSHSPLCPLTTITGTTTVTP